jgi:hypothetical protein
MLEKLLQFQRGLKQGIQKQFSQTAALQKSLVAQASRLCCERSVFSRAGETPVPRL